MTFALKFQDHKQFQRTALLTIVVGAVSGTLFFVSGQLFWSLWPAMVVSSGLLSAAIGSKTGLDAQRRKWHWAFRSILILLAMAAPATLDGPGALIGLGVAAGAAFAIDQARWRGLLAGVAGGLGSVIAFEVAHRVLMSAQFDSAPAILTFGIAGASFGLSLAGPMALRHLELALDIVTKRYRAAWAVTSGEVQELVGRGYGVWNQARDLPEDDENRSLLKEAVLRLFDTAEQWSNANNTAESASEAGLRDRMLSLQKRIESTQDPQAKAEYEQAHKAITEQLKYLDGIRTSRERVVARLHNYLAAMERLRLALVTAQSSRRAAEVAPMASTLEEIGRDIESDLQA